MVKLTFKSRICNRGKVVKERSTERVTCTHDDGLAAGINYLILVSAKFGRKSSIGIGIGGIQCQFLVRHGDRRDAYAISILPDHD
jgi:hypothetical protein